MNVSGNIRKKIDMHKSYEDKTLLWSRTSCNQPKKKCNVTSCQEHFSMIRNIFWCFFQSSFTPDKSFEVSTSLIKKPKGRSKIFSLLHILLNNLCNLYVLVNTNKNKVRFCLLENQKIQSTSMECCQLTGNTNFLVS